VATFGRHDAGITLGQFLKTRIAVALIETCLAVAAAVDAGDFAGVAQGYLLIKQRIERNHFCAERE
jgi:hypothetical protein